jgi:hypothetical protein
MKALTIERWITWALVVSSIVLLGVQLSSLYVTPIHDSYLWWGDESWLMNEYRSQMMSGVFRHPSAYGSSIWIGNPFPFTAMWLTSVLYGAVSTGVQSTALVTIGRTITAVIAGVLLVILWRKGKSLGLSSLSVAAGLALLVSSRSFFLTSHSARYDIITALALLVIVYRMVSELQGTSPARYLGLGLLCGASLIVSAHVPLLLAFPVVYYLIVRRASIIDISRLVVGGLVSVAILYVVHLLLQPTLTGETNLSENLRTIPILRPFSWSVQSSNLLQKWESVLSFAPHIMVFLLACVEGLRCTDVTSNYKRSIILLILPVLGWSLVQPAGPTSYLIHFLACLALAAMMSIETVLVGNWQRIVVGATVMIALAFGVRDAFVAREVGNTLTAEHRKAITEVERLHSVANFVAMNPAQSFLRNGASTTHFIELPNRGAKTLVGEGYLLTYNSSIQPGFMWEVMPLRAEVSSPELVLTGRFLDVGRRYFEPLDERLDTMFLQRLDLSELYKRHIR